MRSRRPVPVTVLGGQGAIGLFMSAMYWSSWSMAGRERRRTIIDQQDHPLP